MWLCFNDAFVSAVQHNDDPSLVVVRARDPEHLMAVFPDQVDDIFHVPGSDYDCRIIVSKKHLADVVRDRITLDLNYGNFKDSVANKKLHNFYTSVWYAGLKWIGGRSYYNP